MGKPKKRKDGHRERHSHSKRKESGDKAMKEIYNNERKAKTKTCQGLDQNKNKGQKSKVAESHSDEGKEKKTENRQKKRSIKINLSAQFSKVASSSTETAPVSTAQL